MICGSSGFIEDVRYWSESSSLRGNEWCAYMVRSLNTVCANTSARNLDPLLHLSPVHRAAVFYFTLYKSSFVECTF